MKLFKKIFISIVICLAIIPCLFITQFTNTNVANAASTPIIDYKMTIKAILDDFISETSRHNRFAGSLNEKNAANYIKDKMVEFGLEPVNNQSTKEGIQKFDINTDSGLVSSQNVIFKKSGSSSDKKVIIATHYDTIFAERVNDDGKVEKVGSAGVFESGIGVSTLLLLAQVLNFESFDFDIEFIFFGAHNHNLAGSSFYTSFISQTESNNILLMINLDNIVSDGMLYLYNGEFKSATDNYVFDKFTKNFNANRMSDYSIISDTTTSSVNGLDYTNFAIESDNANFIRVGVNTLSPVSVSANQVNSIGIINYMPIVSIFNDNIEYVSNATNGKYLNCPSLIVNGCLNLLKDNSFINNMSQSSVSNLYNILGNKKLMVFIAFIILIVILFIYSIIKNKLDKNARKARTDLQLDKVIATIMPSELEDMDSLMERLEKQFEENAKKADEERNNKNKDLSKKSEIKEDKVEDDKSNSSTDDNLN